MMPDPKNGSAARPSRIQLATAAALSSRRPIRRWVIGLDRLIGGSMGRLAILVSTRLEQGAQRRVLHRLNDHMLKDIGMARRNVEREVRLR
jgi:uncharacterized protein YjiS (DUF1127 family)